ncbi:MAG TPA: alpha/beta hydrolase, partial [Planctomycetota bacterium]|nr:alpha/beta hydrolase [Planctomycetota bacterium]
MSADGAGRRGTVVLLHGLNRTQLSMALLAWRLQRAGYATANLYYPSRSRTIEQHADRLLARLSAGLAPPGGPLHFVAHSLGCLVVRCALARGGGREPLAGRAGRCVMLGPPNQGS